ncbi:MAG: bifunctional oligoribonuclease/PAP phosphatase NrnA [Phycisphaerales bacterium]|nr:bifunctional oligoribonuclease/PAP phosphatase NrnA [Phycisphaerales bacterium]
MNTIQHEPISPEVLSAIRAARRVALVGHVTPDADCLAVIGAMAHGLRAMGKQPAPSMPAGSVAEKLRFMVDIGGWQPASSAELAECDVALVMDTAKDKRVNVDGKLEALPKAKIVNVDHHSSNTRFGDALWIDGARSSSAEMVYELLKALEVKITPQIATLLYAGIHSDTGGFSLPNTTPRSLEVAAELSLAGADIVDTCEQLCRSQTPHLFNLLKVVYGNTRVSEDGRLSWSTANYNEIHDAGCVAEDIDDQVEIPRSIRGVTIAVLFSEGVKGKIRMNFRGDRGCSILELAQQFHGGGHSQAAGAILDGTIEQVVAKVIPAAQAYLNERS